MVMKSMVAMKNQVAAIQVMPRPINTAIMTPIPTITHFFDFIAIKEGLVTSLN